MVMPYLGVDNDDVARYCNGSFRSVDNCLCGDAWGAHVLILVLWC